MPDVNLGSTAERFGDVIFVNSFNARATGVRTHDDCR
jgi:hypothetical protein